MDSNALTLAQQQALEKAYDLLGEHFDHVLIAISTEYAQEDGMVATRVFWKGGPIPAIGLCEEAKTTLLNTGKRTDSEP